MTASDVSRQPAWSKTFFERAQQENTAALAAYLLRLIAIKRTNLCVSADVTTTRELLELAEDVGDYICLLKTHADIVVDFGDRTVQGLREIARRKKFLIFEDRKFSDIGSKHEDPVHQYSNFLNQLSQARKSKNGKVSCMLSHNHRYCSEAIYIWCACYSQMGRNNQRPSATRPCYNQSTEQGSGSRYCYIQFGCSHRDHWWIA